MKIGNRIKQRRKDLRLTADELGKKLGKDRSTIYRYENGDIENMPLDILEPIAAALDTTPQYLMGWEDKKIPTEEEGFLDGDTERMRSLIKRIRTCSPEELDRMEQILRIVQGE